MAAHGSNIPWLCSSCYGHEHENAVRYMKLFEHQACSLNIQEQKQKISLFYLSLKDEAQDWLFANNNTDNFAELKSAFLQRFAETRLPKWRTYEQFFNQTQLPGQGAENFIDRMSAKAKQMDIDKDSTLHTTLR